MPRWKTSSRPALPASHGHDPEAGSDDFHDLVQVCLLVLLRDGPASSEALREGLRPLGIEQSIGTVEAALDVLVTAGLARSAGAPSGDGSACCAYAITGNGTSWLRDVTIELRRTEVVLGRFLARCGERLLSHP